MKIIVSKDEIQERLSNIQNIVEKRNTMPILSHFLLEAGKAGSSITATDLETALKEPLRITVEKEGSICIPAKKLFEIVREIDGDIVLETVDDQWLKIKAGASSFRLACLSSKEFPAWPGMDDMEELTIGAKLLAELIEKTLFSAGESDTRYTLNGILFHVMPGLSITTVGTDGHRLAYMRKTIEGSITEEKKIILPRKSAGELKKLIDKSDSNVKMSISKNHILFSIGDMQFLTRLIEGTYPNYEQVIPSGNEKMITVSRDLLAKVLRRVSIMSKEKSNAIKMDLSANLITLTSSNPDIGEARDEIAIEYAAEEMALGFNARFLIDICEAMSTEKITLEMQAPLSPVLVKEENSDDYKCVIMPMRI